VYLDGGYGVGKTHLLAGTYHAVQGKRRYLSSGELACTISWLGLEAALDALQHTRLLCIDGSRPRHSREKSASLLRLRSMGRKRAS
jgi:predicted ATPase